MFCKNCGKEVNDNAVICPNCGVQLAQLKGGKAEDESKSNSMAIIGFVLSFFISIAGLICSIIAYRKCRDEGLNGKGLAIAGIAISVASMVLAFIYIIAASAIACSIL